MAEAEEISAFMIARHTNVNLFYFPMTLHYPIHASFPPLLSSRYSPPYLEPRIDPGWRDTKINRRGLGRREASSGSVDTGVSDQEVERGETSNINQSRGRTQTFSPFSPILL